MKLGPSARRIDIKGYYIAEGPLRIRILSGNVALSGAIFKPKSELIVPLAKSTLLETLEEATVEVIGSGTLRNIETSTIPNEWSEIAHEIITKGYRSIVVLGAIDTGKTFFTTYLANVLFSRGLKVAIVDTDVGQSDIGPPTTIGLGILRKPVIFMDQIEPSEIYFIGSTSPTGHLLPMVVGMEKMVSTGLALVDIVLVDTPGMVFGGPARALMLYSTEALRPDLVVILQKLHELEHLARQLEALGHNVRRLPASRWVKERDRSDRRLLRERAFYNYFSKRGIRRLTLDLSRVTIVGSYLGSGSEVPRQIIENIEAIARLKVEYCEMAMDYMFILFKEALPSRDTVEKLYSSLGKSGFTIKVRKTGFEKGLVVGLIGDYGKYLDIGVLEKIDFKGGKLVVVSPLEDPTTVRAIKIGCVRLDENFREIGKLRPGFI